MKFEGVGPISREAAALEFSSADRDRISTALVRLALHDEDRAWLENLCLGYMNSDDPWIRGVAALCVGHVGRIHGAIDLDAVLPALTRLLSDPETAGRAQGALDDIDAFVLQRGTP